MVNEWTNPNVVKGLTANEIPGCFGSLVLNGGVAGTSGNIIMRPIYQTCKDIPMNLYILLGKAMTDICEHIFGENHSLCAARIQNARTVENAIAKQILFNMHEGQVIVHPHFSSIYYIFKKQMLFSNRSEAYIE